MSDDNSRSLVNLGNLSKPADTLIKKVSSAVGGLFAPYQVKRMAKAEAEASLISANAEIEVTDLHRRAMHRFVEEEASRQKNMEDITEQAISDLGDDSDPSEVDDDWISNFFEKARIVSDKEMQELWSKVLSGEANRPGSYSRRTVNLIADLDKNDALLFSRLCSYGWMVGNIVPLVFDVQDEIYNSNGINFNSLSHLETLGLIQFNNIAGFSRLKLPKRFAVMYYGRPLQLEMEHESDNKLNLGNVLLTQAGQELAPVCGSKPVDGFFEYVQEKWKKHLPESPEQDAPADADKPRG
jgi:hypothetical protein